jgi:hypothetical protein
VDVVDDMGKTYPDRVLEENEVTSLELRHADLRTLGEDLPINSEMAASPAGQRM